MVAKLRLNGEEKSWLKVQGCASCVVYSPSRCLAAQRLLSKNEGGEALAGTGHRGRAPRRRDRWRGRRRPHVVGALPRPELGDNLPRRPLSTGVDGARARLQRPHPARRHRRCPACREGPRRRAVFHGEARRSPPAAIGLQRHLRHRLAHHRRRRQRHRPRRGRRVESASVGRWAHAPRAAAHQPSRDRVRELHLPLHRPPSRSRPLRPEDGGEPEERIPRRHRAVLDSRTDDVPAPRADHHSGAGGGTAHLRRQQHLVRRASPERRRSGCHLEGEREPCARRALAQPQHRWRCSPRRGDSMGDLANSNQRIGERARHAHRPSVADPDCPRRLGPRPRRRARAWCATGRTGEHHA